ncbi:MAG: hemolysin III family protein [Oscillospiraceae bacterium]|nr:hemolysin III family protein [Oscillospiraceae bacterium]
MKRTPLDERQLPDYSRGEELVNMITHITGGAIGVSILVFGILIAAGHRNPWAIVGASIYGTAMVWLYTMSSIYHGLPAGRGKKVLQVLDHCTIYALIAGTYTPILLAAIRPAHPGLAWTVFGCEWGLAALGATLTAIDLKKYRIFSMLCYIGMGWFILLALKPTIEAVTLPGFLWLLGGGVAYTLGAGLYALGKKRPYFHSLFHVFVVLGSLLQAICILVYVL